MESKKKNIEQVFKEQFQDFEITPPDHLWDNISKEIEEKEESKKVIPLWFYGSGIAASLLLFFGLYLYISTENTPVENKVVFDNVIEKEIEETINQIQENSTEEQNNDIVVVEEKTTENPLTGNKQEQSSSSSISKNNKKDVITNSSNNYNNPSTTLATSNSSTKENKNSYPQNIEKEENTATSINIADSKKHSKPLHNKTAVAENKIIKKQQPLIEEHKEQIDDALLAETLKGENNEVANKKTIEKRWSIQPQVGSFYYDSFAGSPIGESFSENPQFLESSFNYGARVAYQVTPKLKIRTGATFNSFKLTTSSIGVESNINSSVTDVFANTDVNIVNVFVPNSNFDNSISETDTEEIESEELVDPLEEITVEPQVENPTTEEEGFDNERIENEELEGPTEMPSERTLETGGITQQISYLEIPIEVAYNILDKKFSIDLIGGMSTFILANNDSYFQSNSTNTITQLGETSTLSQTSFTANFGFSANYNFAKSWSFNLEPVMKIQFNSINESSNYSPFFIGVSSGVTWKF